MFEVTHFFVDSKLPFCFIHLVALEQGVGGVGGVGHFGSELLLVHFQEVGHTDSVVGIQVALGKC